MCSNFICFFFPLPVVVFALVSIFWPEVYCSHDQLELSINNPTTFCTLSGIIDKIFKLYYYYYYSSSRNCVSVHCTADWSVLCFPPLGHVSVSLFS